MTRIVVSYDDPLEHIGVMSYRRLQFWIGVIAHVPAALLGMILGAANGLGESPSLSGLSWGDLGYAAFLSLLFGGTPGFCSCAIAELAVTKRAAFGFSWIGVSTLVTFGVVWILTSRYVAVTAAC